MNISHGLTLPVFGPSQISGCESIMFHENVERSSAAGAHPKGQGAGCATAALIVVLGHNKEGDGGHDRFVGPYTCILDHERNARLSRESEGRFNFSRFSNINLNQGQRDDRGTNPRSLTYLLETLPR